MPDTPTGRRFVIMLMVATFVVPVVCVVLAIVLQSAVPLMWGLVPTLFLALGWYTAESGHRKSAHPSRQPGGTAHPVPDDAA